MNKPLLNKTVVITRSEEQSESAKNIFEGLGADTILFPTIKVSNPESYEFFDKAVNNFEDFDYLIFTSVNAVDKFFERLNIIDVSLNFRNVKTIVTGSKTAEACKKYNIDVYFIPDKYSAGGIIDQLKDEIVNKKILIPCSAIARKELAEGLSAAGAVVTKVPIYDVGIPGKDEIREQLEKLNTCIPDVFIFTSPSTFRNFLLILKINDPKIYFKDYIIAAIGTTTESAIKEYDLNVDIVPPIFTLEAVADAIVNYFENIDLTIKH